MSAPTLSAFDSLTPAQQMAILGSGGASIGQPSTMGPSGSSTPYSQTVYAPLSTFGNTMDPASIPIGTTTSSSTTSPDQQNPIDYSQLLPSASQYESFAPLPYQSFGATPQISAATLDPALLNYAPGMQAAYVNNSELPGALSSYEQAVQSSLNPTFQQQNQQLTASEADRGIFNSTAGQQLQNDLSGQQAAAVSSAIEPLISQFASQYGSNNQLNATNQQAANSTNYQGLINENELLANLQQTAGLANQTAENQANVYNADAYGAVTGSNQSAYNNYLSTLMGDQNTLSNGLLTSALSTYDPSMYSSLLSNGLNNAGTAANNAYNSASSNSGNLTSALGNLGSSLFSHSGSTSSVPQASLVPSPGGSGVTMGE